MTVTSTRDLNRAARADSASTGFSSGARLISAEGAELPLRGTDVSASAQGGIARVTLTQSFVNRGTEPLRVTYLLPLPENAAVSGYEFVLDGVRTVGVVKAREDARRAFEEALIEGRSAALLEEERSTLFRQEIGNVPPGAEISIEVKVDQKLTWRGAEGAWEWRFPTVVAPRFQGEAGRVPDAAENQVPIADLEKGEHLSVRAMLELNVSDALNGAPTSPSHGIAFGKDTESKTLISFEDEGGTSGPGVALDRDIVVRWPVTTQRPGVSFSMDDAGEAGPFGLLTIVPPTASKSLTVPRDLIVLLDTSGSMGGEPLRQAVSVISDLVDSLGKRDRLEMIEFSQKARRWKHKAVKATASNREKAKDWLGSLQAGGCTYMRDGILEALAPLGAEAQRQVLLVTDGLIGFENEIIEEVAHRLPAACRVHTLGIGHGVNRSLTGPVARAGRGVEQIVAPGEDVTKAAAELLAMTRDPVLVDLQVSGNVELAARIPDVLAGSPAIIPVRLNGGAAPMDITVTGRMQSGTWSRILEVQPENAPKGSGANAQLFAREKVQDLELDGAAGGNLTDVDAEIERIGLDFQIATRRTSWVAVSDAQTVDPTAATRTVTMPHELAAGLSAEGVGLRSAMAETMFYGAPMADCAPRAAAPMGMGSGAIASQSGGSDELKRLRKPRVHITFSEGASDKRSGGGQPPAKDEELTHQESAERPEGDDSTDLGFKGSAPKELSGKVLLWEDGQLVLAIDVVNELEWEQPSEVIVVRADGTQLTIKVALDRSTASGRVRPGQTIRLTLVGVPESAKEAVTEVRIAGPALTPITISITK